MDTELHTTPFSNQPDWSAEQPEQFGSSHFVLFQSYFLTTMSLSGSWGGWFELIPPWLWAFGGSVPCLWVPWWCPEGVPLLPEHLPGWTREPDTSQPSPLLGLAVYLFYLMWLNVWLVFLDHVKLKYLSLRNKIVKNGLCYMKWSSLVTYNQNSYILWPG